MCFGLGLVLSGMCRPSKIASFLILSPSVWDPTLAFVMVSAVGINLITFHFILARSKPVYDERFALPSANARVDTRLVLGAAIFGCGWGLSALCPGPGLVNLFVLSHALFWVIGLALGSIAFEITLKKYEKW